MKARWESVEVRRLLIPLVTAEQELPAPIKVSCWASPQSSGCSCPQVCCVAPVHQHWGFPSVPRPASEYSSPGRPLSCFVDENTPVSGTNGASCGQAADPRLAERRVRSQRHRNYMSRTHLHTPPDLPEGYGMAVEGLYLWGSQETGKRVMSSVWGTFHALAEGNQSLWVFMLHFMFLHLLICLGFTEQRTTQQGQVYFLHTQTGVSTWHDPRVPR